MGGAPSGPVTPISRAWRWGAGLALLFSLQALALGLWQAEALREGWAALQPGTLLAAAGLCWLNYLLRGLRWVAWVRQGGAALDWGRGLRLYLCGYAFTATPGNVGEALRGAWVRPGQPLWSLAIFGAERLADLLALLLLSLPALPLLAARLPEGLGAGLALGAMALGGLLLLPSLRQAMGSRVPPWVLAALGALRRRPAGWMLASLLAWAAQGLAVWLLARDLALPLDLGRAQGIYAAAMVGGALSALPAGLGSMEALLTAMLVASGAALAPALVLVLLVRVFTLWQAIVAGALILAWSLIVLKDPRLG